MIRYTKQIIMYLKTVLNVHQIKYDVLASYLAL